jgi:hypothetical protein
MYSVVRQYSGAGSSDLFDLIEQRSDDVKRIISGTPGFISYVAFRDEGGGGTTVTSCQDKAGVDESSKRAADWVSENASFDIDPPEIVEGSPFLQF